MFLDKVKMANTKLSSYFHSQSTSNRKVNFSHVHDSFSDSDSEINSCVNHIQASGNGYSIWDWGQLQSLISSSCVCKMCCSQVELDEHVKIYMGWCSSIALKMQVSAVCISPTSVIYNFRIYRISKDEMIQLAA